MTRPNRLGYTKCTDCNELITSFIASYSGSTLRGICKQCINKRHKKWRDNNPHIFRDNFLKAKYGISYEEYKKKVDLQFGGCAICKQPAQRELDVDHNHKTNQVRDLLCNKCNTMLGLVNEDEDILWNMLEYLKRHGLKDAI